MRPMKKLQIGKNKITPEFVKQAKKMFENSEIIKVSILKSACRGKEEAKKMADELVTLLGPNFDYRLVGYVLSIRRFRKPRTDKALGL